MDIASIAGILLALAGILGGLLLEGGTLRQVTQPTALMIVLGGTLGAVMLEYPVTVLGVAARHFFSVFRSRGRESEAVVAQLVSFANKARRSGILSLDADLASIDDPFLKQALMLAIDGTEPAAVRQIMQLELDNTGDGEARIPQVFESAGGFSPTIGIIGAVIGLIQVMQHLEDINEVGRGIAVAFVATIYGVGLANLVFLPVAGKLRIRQQEEQTLREMTLEGVTSIQEGMNPRTIEIKLRTFLFDAKKAVETVDAR
ncbi:MAG TPA: flagellar motor protein [Acidobacteriaceae bacterium]